MERTIQDESWSYLAVETERLRTEYYKPWILEITKMNNLEFMNRYERFKNTGVLSVTESQLAMIVSRGKIPIGQMTNEQLLELQVEVPKLIENLRIALQVADQTGRERGKQVKMRLKESDLNYVMPADEQLKKMEKKLSKKGESEEKINRIKSVVNDLDFSDI